MKLRSILSESFRDYVRGSRALPLALILLAIIVVPSDLEMSTAAELTAQTRQWQAAGASTFLVNAPQSVDASACDALTETGIVSASGALRPVDAVALDVLPAQTLPVYGATPGFLTLVGLSAQSASRPGGVAVARTIWDSTRPPDVRELPAAGYHLPPLTVEAVFEWPSDGRSPALGSAILAPQLAGPSFDQCWVRAADPTIDPRWVLSSTIRPGADPTQVRVVQLNPTLGETLNTATQFATRPTAAAAWVAGLAALLLAVAATWARRVQIAAGKELGMDPVTAATNQCLDAISWCLTSIILAAPVILWRAHLLAATDQEALARLTIPIVSATFAGVIAGTTLTVLMIRRRSVADLLRTR